MALNERSVVKPRSSPAREIFEAYQAEARKRNGREPGVWMEKETNAVRMAAIEAARRVGGYEPSVEEIEQAAYRVMNHANYGTEWANSVARLVSRRSSRRLTRR